MSRLSFCVPCLATLLLAGCPTPPDQTTTDDAAIVAIDAAPPDLTVVTCNPPCAAPTPFCNAMHQCVACVKDADCPVGNVCKTGLLGTSCAPGCTDDSRCPNGQKCCNAACTDTKSDALNCGGCGMKCSGNHAAGVCAAGTCQTGTCNQNWGDCNSDPKDGCESNFLVDANNCGGCGMKCSIPNAIVGCAGTCYVKACQFGYDDCNNDLKDGCETSVLSDPKNCGACKMNCASLPNANVACASAQCLIGSCQGTYLDCDRSPANGCEVNGGIDANNCGACGNVCAQGLVCRGGRCTCPMCNIPNASSTCVNGVCMLDQCNIGFANCDGNAANGCEINLNTDNSNCSACGMPCAQGLSCSQGMCVNIPANPFFDSLSVRGSSTARGAGDACGTNVTVSQNVTVHAIAVSSTLGNPGNIKFMIFTHPAHQLVYQSNPKPFAQGAGWHESDAVNVVLQAGQSYCIGGISDVPASWDYDVQRESMNNVSSTTTNPNWTGFVNTVVGGHGGADCGIRLY